MNIFCVEQQQVASWHIIGMNLQQKNLSLRKAKYTHRGIYFMELCLPWVILLFCSPVLDKFS